MDAPMIELSISPSDSLWLAGLLEGEGSFFMTHSRPGRLYPVVQLKMNDWDVVRRAADIMGCKTITTVRRHGVHRDGYQVVPTGSRAVCVMEAILPHMGKRRTVKIHELLKVYDNYQRSLTKVRNDGGV